MVGFGQFDLFAPEKKKKKKKKRVINESISPLHFLFFSSYTGQWTRGRRRKENEAKGDCGKVFISQWGKWMDGGGREFLSEATGRIGKEEEEC